MRTTLAVTSMALCAVLLFPATGVQAVTFNLDFTTVGSGSGILDTDGQDTGFTTRLSGTGGILAASDTNLDINTGTGKLTIQDGDGTGANQDFNGQAGLDTLEALGIQLSALGYTGTEDFIVTATFDALPPTESFDQAGIFIGSDSATMTRAGFITFSAQEYFAGHTTAGADNNGRFFGFGFNGADGMNVTITRLGGDWRYFIDGLEWQPNTDGGGAGTPVDPTGANGSPDLQSLSDLTVGVFGINVVNTNSETFTLDNFRVIVDPVVGDANNDTVVDENDFFLISDHMFTQVIPGTTGDVTFDGNVGYDDFRLWKNVAPLSALQAAGFAVPEPGALSLAMLALMGFGMGGRRNRR